MKTVLTKALDWTAAKLTTARDAIRDLRGAESAISEQHVAATAERVQLLSAKPPKAEVLAEIDKDLAHVRRQSSTLARS